MMMVMAIAIVMEAIMDIHIHIHMVEAALRQQVAVEVAALVT
jgi:hypothetical protein